MRILRFPLGRTPKALYHILFVCSFEKRHALRLTHHVSGKRMVWLVAVPGNLHRVLIHRECTDFAMATTKKLLAWMLMMHSLEVSLDGKFKLRDLYVTAAGEVKIKSSKRKYIKPLTLERKTNDRLKIAEIIHIIISGQNTAPGPLPQDILHLLDLLSNGMDEDDFVLGRHPAGMTGLEKLALFTELFSQLESIQSRDTEKYNRIIDSLPFGNGDWMKRITNQAHLMRVFRYKGRQGYFSRRPAGMLRLKRNALDHLVGDAVAAKKKKRLKVKGLRVRTKKTNMPIQFSYNQIAYMFSQTFPQVLAKLQLSLHREQELTIIYRSCESA